ncbi:5-oxoprolinase subunit PxpA [Arenimonas sp. GDDSR-1]|uniref:5-oxoprolinase subunit PxpA n=1 Tax=Arenimonas sp. GDDSR-1 TaxID=2950125 RepID=UPI0026262AE1|nr:5-oxoprolinase subunit PxpA [Arenimonas sp. GDDSR-1]
MNLSIDINADLGELDADLDAAMMPFISSANIACGFHAGSPIRMRETVLLCLKFGVAIGAHPSYFDRRDFGRRELGLDAETIYSLTLYQIGALNAMVAAEGGRLRHVKPHGALYNRAAVDAEAAHAVASAVRDADAGLVLVGLAGSALIDAGKALGLTTWAEGFADRRYTDNGLLLPRSHAAALITDTDEAIAQTLAMVRDGVIPSVNGQPVRMTVDTVCLHGDGKHALAFAAALHAALHAAGIGIAPGLS